MRAQANLLSVAVALLLVTVATVVSLGIAGGALADADRQPADRRTAARLAAELVAPDGGIAARRNVLRERTLAGLDATGLRRLFDAETGGLRVAVDGRSLVEVGDPQGGATVRRLVLVETLTPRRVGLAGRGSSVRLPSRAANATVRLAPPAGTTLRTVRVDGRVVLHNRSGLAGNYSIDLPVRERPRLSFAADGPLPGGSVTIGYAAASTRSAVLAVTVDA
jgi:hypothetical protein